VISLINVLNQSMQVLTGFVCLMFILISLLLPGWELLKLNFKGFSGFAVLKNSFSQTVSLIVLLNNKGYPLKILLKRVECCSKEFSIWSIPNESV
jgi:hypothetical protein